MPRLLPSFRLSLPPNHASIQHQIPRASRRTRLACIAQSSRRVGPVEVSEEVRCALAENHPVVALESTIITHGMPYPQNLSTARSVQGLIRAEGVTPATISVLDGVIKVGLTDQELEELATKGKDKVSKCSIRDLPFIISRKLDGATTVAATMHIAHLVGISVFVTGGIGGVHYGGEQTLDISSDLIAAGSIPMIVVCAGAKSVLDIPRTLEYLETQGVCVAAYQTDEFPAFFTARSGSRAPIRVDTPKEVAELLIATRSIHLEKGIVLGVPIAQEDAALGESIEESIAVALEECQASNIAGPEVTPFLLDRVAKLSSGASLEANIRLIQNNAKIGCAIAKELAQPQ